MRRVLRSQSDYRSTLMRNQLTSLVLYEVITTREGKARELVQFANRFFNRVKSGDLNAKRLAHEVLFDLNAVKKVFEEILPRFSEKDTTYVGTVKVAPRRGDTAAQRAVVLLAETKIESKTTPKKTDTAKTPGAVKTAKPAKTKVAKKS